MRKADKLKAAVRAIGLVAMLGFGAVPVLPQDPVKVSPNDYKVEIDNAWVRVVRVKHPPHARIALHEHLPNVAVFLTDAHEKLTATDGSTREVTRKAGEVAYNDASKHTEENMSDKALEAIVVELKPGAAKSAPITLDPVKLDPKHHIVEFENGRVRVLRTILEPHLKSPMHEHPHYVVVYLTDLHTTMQLPDGKTVSGKSGDEFVEFSERSHTSMGLACQVFQELWLSRRQCSRGRCA